MTYRILQQQLRTYADQAKEFFCKEWGLSASKFIIEQPIAGTNLSFEPTLHVILPDGLVCVDLYDSPTMPRTMFEMLVTARADLLPLKLYLIQYPERSTYSERYLSDHGVGVLDLLGTPKILRHPLFQSLHGVRSVSPELPRKYRRKTSDARVTFVNGDPEKACQTVCQELEDLTRRFAGKAAKAGAVSPSANLQKQPWAIVADLLINKLDRTMVKNAPSREVLIQVRAVIDSRNKTSHKSTTWQQRRQRDSRLRTWFEQAVDALADMAKATRM